MEIESATLKLKYKYQFKYIAFWPRIRLWRCNLTRANGDEILKWIWSMDMKWNVVTERGNGDGDEMLRRCVKLW